MGSRNQKAATKWTTATFFGFSLRFLIFFWECSFLVILLSRETWSKCYRSWSNNYHQQQLSERRHSLNLLPVATPEPRVVAHPYSIPLNWRPWHMVGTSLHFPLPCTRDTNSELDLTLQFPTDQQGWHNYYAGCATHRHTNTHILV